MSRVAIIEMAITACSAMTAPAEFQSSVTEPRAEQRPMGGSHLNLPRVSLGCGSFGGVGGFPQFFGEGLTLRQASGLMDAAWRLGITHFDTAAAYGGGRSEQMIGDWIRVRGVRPTLTTKISTQGAGGNLGLVPELLARQLEASLERLGVDCVELCLAHSFDPSVPLNEVCAAFEQLRQAGRIRGYGVSNFSPAQLSGVLAAGAPQAIQSSHSLLSHRATEQLLVLCAQHKISFLASSPLAGGWLTGMYRRGQPFPLGSRMLQLPQLYESLLTDSTFIKLERLHAIAGERGTSMAGIALAWLLADDRVSQIITGPDRPEHLTAIQQAFKQPLSAADREAIDAVFGTHAPSYMLGATTSAQYPHAPPLLVPAVTDVRV